MHLKSNITRMEFYALWKMVVDPSTRSTNDYNMESREVQLDPPTSGSKCKTTTIMEVNN